MGKTGRIFMNLIIAGCNGYGKDTVCMMLEGMGDWTTASSSWIACQAFLFEQLKDKYGYATPEECHADRVNHRQEWYEAIRDFNKHDRAALAKHIFSKVNIYNGIRDLEELDAIRAAGLVDLVIWVDRSLVKSPEPITSMNVNHTHCDIILDNNGDEEHLRRSLFTLLNLLPDCENSMYHFRLTQRQVNAYPDRPLQQHIVSGPGMLIDNWDQRRLNLPK
jgi:hypothetical protein